MSWFKEKFKAWVRQQCREAWDEAEEPVQCVPVLDNVKSRDDIFDHRKAFNVRMQPAKGGTIIEVSHYDSHHGEYNRDLYIVGTDGDIGSEISSILVHYQLTHG